MAANVGVVVRMAGTTVKMIGANKMGKIPFTTVEIQTTVVEDVVMAVVIIRMAVVGIRIGTMARIGTMVKTGKVNNMKYFWFLPNLL